MMDNGHRCLSIASLGLVVVEFLSALEQYVNRIWLGIFRYIPIRLLKNNDQIKFILRLAFIACKRNCWKNWFENATNLSAGFYWVKVVGFSNREPR